MLQSSKVSFFFGIIVFSALLNNYISHARRDIFLRGNSEESIINKEEPSDEKINKITIAHTKTGCDKERERKMLSHAKFTRSKCETRDVGKHRQVSGANNSDRKFIRRTKEDMTISIDFKPSFNPRGNPIDGKLPFTSDYGRAMKHPPRHN